LLSAVRSDYSSDESPSLERGRGLDYLAQTDTDKIAIAEAAIARQLGIKQADVDARHRPGKTIMVRLNQLNASEH
jgi:hypothetical protein